MGFPVANASEHHLLHNYLEMQQDASETYYKGFLDKDMDFHICDIYDNFFENEDNLETLEFNEQEKMMYRYNPIQLCIDLYGTHDFWQILLQINDIDSEGEFDLSGPIKVPRKTEFILYLTEIYDIKRHEFIDGTVFERTR